MELRLELENPMPADASAGFAGIFRGGPMLRTSATAIVDTAEEAEDFGRDFWHLFVALAAGLSVAAEEGNS